MADLLSSPMKLHDISCPSPVAKPAGSDPGYRARGLARPVMSVPFRIVAALLIETRDDYSSGRWSCIQAGMSRAL